MKLSRRLRIILWLGATFALLLIVALAVEHVRGRLALNQRLRALKASGERLRIAELLPARPPTESNALLPFMLLTNRLRHAWSNIGDAPPYWRLTPSGRMVTVWQFDQWKFGRQTNDWQRAVKVTSESGDLLRELHASWQRPGWDSGFSYTNGFDDLPMQSLAATKMAAQFLSTAASCELREGRPEQAAAHVLGILRLLDVQRDERLMITHLVRIACGAIAWNATWQLLQTNAWTDPQLAMLQSAWQRLQFAEDLAMSMEMERAMTLEELQTHSRRVWAQLDAVSDEWAAAFSDLPSRGWVRAWVHRPLWLAAWEHQDALRALNRWQDAIEGLRTTKDKSWGAVSDRLKSMPEDGGLWNGDRQQQNLYDRWRFHLSNQLWAVGQGVISKTARAMTSGRMVVTALAIHRYRLRHGQPPPTLETLVPEFLPAVPIDGMDGKPLRYRLHLDGSFTLYSVGEDGEDNGGDASSGAGKSSPVSLWKGRDAVWPQAASPEEAAQVMMGLPPAANLSAPQGSRAPRR